MQFRLLGEDGRLTHMNMILRFLRGDSPAGLKIMVVSITGALLSMLPLFVYIAIGPADGNPIGLGLLAFAGMLAGVCGFLLGLVWLVTEHLMNKSGT